ncbi:MAG: DUF423 domain-containing protein, partial [Trueperaceae bacterium]|nr:DUF423 domain-containing protein [Trueperaceae bacterium]
MTRASDASPAWGVLGAALAGTAVALGAFGAHALDGVLSPRRLETFETAVRYQFLHALALLVLHQARLAGTMAEAAAARVGGTLLAGTAVFSGALYALVATDVGAFGAVAPIGGGLLILGWAQWAWSARPRRSG